MLIKMYHSCSVNLLKSFLIFDIYNNLAATKSVSIVSRVAPESEQHSPEYISTSLYKKRKYKTIGKFRFVKMSFILKHHKNDDNC